MAATIKDVAKLAGVSVATVSRAVSGKVVSHELKSKVEEAILATGYRPNLAARRLRGHSNDMIGLIIADIRNPFFTRFARAIDDIAKTKNQHVILCNTDENFEQEKAYLDLMEEENVAGIILSPTLLTSGKHITSRKEKPAKLQRPLVLVDRTPDEMIYDSVLIDNHAAAKKLVQHLYENGRKHILCLYGADSRTGFERQKGFDDAIRALHLSGESVAVKHGKDNLAKSLKNALANNPDSDALIVTNGVLALKAAAFLEKAGIVVPDQLAFAAFDDEPWMELVFNGITTIAQPVGDIAREAYHCLMERLENPLKPVRQTVLKSKLIVRGSTLKARTTTQ